MFKTVFKPELLLLITAFIWGFAFVAQTSAMDHIGPYSFNALRFFLGSLSLVPVMFWLDSRPSKKRQYESMPTHSLLDRTHLVGGIVMGSVLFIAASLQQVGLLYTTAGNAGFITSLYIIFAPIIGIFIGQKTQANTWVGAVLALIGLYLLSVKGDFSISFGDLLQLIGAVFWALHILVISHYSPKASSIKLSIIQFALCGILSLFVGIAIETFEFGAILNVLPELLYLGILSTCVAYTLQVVAQKNVPPANAAIIFSLEAVFALLVVGCY